MVTRGAAKREKLQTWGLRGALGGIKASKLFRMKYLCTCFKMLVTVCMADIR